MVQTFERNQLSDGAMKRFLSSAAPSSSGRAEPPSSSSSAEQPAASLRSAEQPATPSHLKILSIRDVQRWLAEEPIANCSSANAQRIREAIAVLSHPKPRQEDVRSLQNKWQMAQKRQKAETVRKSAPRVPQLRVMRKVGEKEEKVSMKAV